MKWYSSSPIPFTWIGCCRASLLRESGLKFHWWRSFDSGKASWLTSIFTGTRGRCWSNLGYSMPLACPSPALLMPDPNATGITGPGYNNKNAQTFAPARAVVGIVDAGANIHLDRDHR